MPESKRRNERLVALFVAALLALNFPLLSLASVMKQVWGIPVLYFYLFFVWAFIILASGLTLKRTRDPSGPAPEPPAGT
ncbi:MAG: hypothetical protein ACWGSD_06510 [Thermodesulfobacteriota bacterium]